MEHLKKELEYQGCAAILRDAINERVPCDVLGAFVDWSFHSGKYWVADGVPGLFPRLVRFVFEWADSENIKVWAYTPNHVRVYSEGDFIISVGETPEQVRQVIFALMMHITAKVRGWL